MSRVWFSEYDAACWRFTALRILQSDSKTQIFNLQPELAPVFGSANSGCATTIGNQNKCGCPFDVFYNAICFLVCARNTWTSWQHFHTLSTFSLLIKPVQLYLLSLLTLVEDFFHNKEVVINRLVVYVFLSEMRFAVKTFFCSVCINASITVYSGVACALNRASQLSSLVRASGFLWPLTNCVECKFDSFASSDVSDATWKTVLSNLHVTAKHWLSPSIPSHVEWLKARTHAARDLAFECQHLVHCCCCHFRLCSLL